MGSCYGFPQKQMMKQKGEHIDFNKVHWGLNAGVPTAQFCGLEKVTSHGYHPLPAFQGPGIFTAKIKENTKKHPLLGIGKPNFSFPRPLLSLIIISPNTVLSNFFLIYIGFCCLFCITNFLILYISQNHFYK